MNTEMPCPHCKVELRTLTPNGALSCSSCGGGFCSRSTLQALLRQVELSPPAGSYARPSSSIAGPIRYVTCPVCSELMLRRNFGETSGVVVDVCSSHGVWFDRGELGKIMEFCATGELARAQGGTAERAEAGGTTMSQESLEYLCTELARLLRL